MRKLALFLGRHAARVIEPIRPMQAAAMYAEIEALDDREALGWALGCVAASYRQRASLTAIGVLGARLGVASAAGAFGVLHVGIVTTNLFAKLARLDGQPTAWLPPVHNEGLDSMPLDYWQKHFVILGLLGALHAVAAAMMAAGQNRRVVQFGLAIAGFELLMALMGWSGLTLPAIYLTLTAMLAGASVGLAWLWRWDERRLARL